MRVNAGAICEGFIGQHLPLSTDYADFRRLLGIDSQKQDQFAPPVSAGKMPHLLRSIALDFGRTSYPAKAVSGSLDYQAELTCG